MSKELSAREWIETNEVANLDLPDGTNEMDVEGIVKELCIAFGESYATARLEAYKAEVEEKSRLPKGKVKCNSCHQVVDEGYCSYANCRIPNDQK